MLANTNSIQQQGIKVVEKLIDIGTGGFLLPKLENAANTTKAAGNNVARPSAANANKG